MGSTPAELALVAATCSLFTALPALAQSSIRGPGAGRISGRVTAADRGGPLSGASVRVVDARDARDASGASGVFESAQTTDQQGSYEFTELPAGRYILDARKQGHLTLRSRTVEIADDESRQGVDFTLARSGVIAVHVIDEFGNPRAGVEVSAFQYRGPGAHRKLVPATRQFTTVDGVVVDDRGATVADCAVVIFIDDPGRWTLQSRFVDVFGTDWQGRFRTIALPPGRYSAVAFDRLLEKEAHDPGFLTGLKGRGSRLTLGAGESKTLRLELSPF